MSKQLTNIETYAGLLKGLKAEITQGQILAQRAAEKEKAIAYWNIGDMIDRHVLKNKKRAGYGEMLYERLGKDIQIDRRTLLRTVKFRNTFKKGEISAKLSWSHYKELIAVKDDRKRKSLINRAVREEWRINELRNAIRRERLETEYNPSDAGIERIAFRRGTIYLYRIKEPGFLHDVIGMAVIDCGFNNWKVGSREEMENFHKGDLVETKKTASGYIIRKSDETSHSLYTYRAFAERVVDGDTILANIDIGFGIWSRHHLRLRGLDAPDIKTPEGKASRRYLQKILIKVPYLVVKTYGRDLYGRRLTDIFYGEEGMEPEETAKKGTYLNQQMLDSGHGRIML